MRTKEREQTGEVTSLEELLGRLQSNMRIYDELMVKLAPLKDEQAVKDAILDGVDLETAASDRLEDIAFAALDKLIIDKKVAEISRQLSGMQHSPDQLYDYIYRGHQVEVVALSPDKEKVEDFSYGNLTYLGKSRESASGRIYELGLRPSDGGYIKFANKSRTVTHQASPLFSREEDYRPLFKITPIKD